MMTTRQTSLTFLATIAFLGTLAGVASAPVGPEGTQSLTITGSPTPGHKILVVADTLNPYSQTLLFSSLGEQATNIGFTTLVIGPIAGIDFLGWTDAGGRIAKHYQLPPVFPAALVGLQVHFQAVSIRFVLMDTMRDWTVKSSVAATVVFGG